VANYNDAPYENVVTSGFVVDGEGRKFSKSLGNGVEPKHLLDKYGMDIIRLWVASSDYSEDIRYSPQIMDNMADAYRRFRNTFRWLLGNLNGFDDKDVKLDNLPEMETYILARLGAVLEEARGHFETFQFHKAYRAMYEFCSTDLSNFYFDARKDVLYCDGTASSTRVACLSVLVQIFKGLMTHLAPFISFTTDEAWRARYGDDACVHMETFAIPPHMSVDAAKWEGLMALRDKVNGELEKLRAAGNLGANTEALVVLDAPYDAELIREVCGVSEVVKGAVFAASRHQGHKCPRCWRVYGALEQSGVCLRCDEAIEATKKAA
jgi:isoleucyl-tRNA synthetase